MREVIFAVGEHKICVRHCVVATRRSGFCGHRNSRGPLDRFYGPFGSGEAGETPIKEVQPAAQHLRSISGWIGGDKDQLHLIRNSGGEFLECRADIQHVHRTLIGAERVSEEE